MPRLRKFRRKQKYQYHVNRRRLNKNQKKLPRIDCDAVRNAWDEKKTIEQNLDSMGLLVDPNAMKEFRKLNSKVNLPDKDADVDMEKDQSGKEIPKVAAELQEDAKKRYKDKKSVAHPLPPEMYKKLTKFLDKFGENYEEMARDHTNFLQETTAQLRAQVKRLKNIPQQWIPYLKTRGLINASTSETDGGDFSNVKID